jgi:error-prone DNA polymerase
MVMADFSGSQAEELRRALSFHRSEERMNKVVVKLREAMTRKGVEQEVQDKIVNSVRSFAVYGFPESHAISFALLAYISAWLRVHRKAEFTCALLNNQPMGFYSPSTLVRDAKLHGLRVLPVCVVKSETRCSVVNDLCIRLGLNQLSGVQRATLLRVAEERNRAPWRDLNDFIQRCPMPKKERRIFAKAGALNALDNQHRREALWMVEKEWTHDLLTPEERRAEDSPLLMMNAAERLQADYQTTAVTVGPHPMTLIRQTLGGICRAADLPSRRHGEAVTIAGLVICRQRPGTAKGHVFVSVEDETGVANAFVPSPLFEKQRLVITQESFLEIRGRLQIVDDVITVYAQHVAPLLFETSIASTSHDFH